MRYMSLITQLSRQQPWPSLPVDLIHRMGIWSNPLKNGLIQHTSKFCIFRKIPSNTLGLDATFSCWPQVSMMFQLKRYFENKNIGVRFQIGEPPAKPAKQIKNLGFEKSLRYPPPRKSAEGRGSDVLIFLLKLFFFKIPDLVRRPTAAPVAAENRR